ncbi:hypothetical protein [Fructilactobacillus cliffordii]|uniref:Uncharacterized protein n=1 Tax=Fructilactobacillus cliffordii TaxID=2940299 RepID=A0A9Q8ZVF0_9LACO|nr:hypothetical protein [Fructilactobacillus cliffordii]USS89972.1 hypothetical protein M3M40_07230 [Fructilactobacillus cliffordii]
MARNINLSADERKLEEARKNLEKKKRMMSEMIGQQIMGYKNFKSTADFDRWFKKVKRWEAGVDE